MSKAESPPRDYINPNRLRIRAASNLVGQLLVALPGMPDQRFSRAVIYIVTHGPEGTMGIIINKPQGNMHFADLLQQLDIPLSENTPSLTVMNGGPVESGRGFVLHDEDFALASTMSVESGVSLTSTVDVLRAVAHGHGPSRYLVALGYAGWQPGQLEEELQGNGWLTVPADPSLIFSTDIESKWDMALAKVGATPALLSAHVGRA